MRETEIFYMLPKKYIKCLNEAGNRKKSMAFMSYVIDVDYSGKEEDYEKAQSQRFYAQSWCVSKTCAKNWLVEFEREYRLFNDSRDITKMTARKHVKKTSDHFVTTERPLSDHLDTLETTYTTEFQEMAVTTERPLSDHRVTKDIKTKEIKNKDIYLSPTTQRFIAPTLEQVRERIITKSLNVDAETFYYHYEANGWKVGKATMKSWESALSGWSARNKKESKEQTNNDFGGWR